MFQERCGHCGQAAPYQGQRIQGVVCFTAKVTHHSHDASAATAAAAAAAATITAAATIDPVDQTTAASGSRAAMAEAALTPDTSTTAAANPTPTSRAQLPRRS